MSVQSWVVIPAAGVGKRMNTDRPKQYLTLGKKTVIEHTLDRFAYHSALRGIVVALSPHDQYWSRLNIKTKAPLETVTGGEQRCDSVLNALDHLNRNADTDDWVLVHDAARPCLAKSDLDRLLAMLKDDPVGGILATPVRDTIKRSSPDNKAIETVDRSHLWHALTPQMFRFGTLYKALKRCLNDGFVVTDEASAIEHIRLQPKLIEGRSDNIKITRTEDLALAQHYLHPSRIDLHGK